MLLKLILISGILIATQHVVKVIYWMGFHKTPYNHAPGPCHLVHNIDNGSEDMVLLPSSKVLITSGLIFGKPVPANYKGAVFLYDLNRPDDGAVPLSLVGFSQPIFNPHGISSWVDKENAVISVFIVMHNPESIGRFILDEAKRTLTLDKVYKDTVMKLINSVHPTSEDSFYFTSLLSVEDPLSLWLQIQMLLMIPSGSIIYYDGKDYTTVASGLFLANGITLSHDLKLVYLAANTEVHVYNRTQDNGLTLAEKIPVDIVSDNLFVDTFDDVWVTGTPVFYEAILHMENSAYRTGARVLRIHRENATNTITDVFTNVGDFIVGGTKALYHDSQLLVGTLKDRLLHCHIKAF